MPAMLNAREMEADGIVHRRFYAEVPPKVESSVTPVGASLKPVVAACTLAA